ncbi:uncharacterized protein N7529_011483 [Penicillium soppii]|jgi:hypothetical protein|uniref:uncharacterized protein n=1 Tax=Penicillium soppii TaxID=69789 RepID=UPI0025496388|nr:uncharacterized protein N7529_011483 [Penicillium soppii]KAJ5852098.1 hypothetical protein N7529_011483 [Penicillium soppii]
MGLPDLDQDIAPIPRSREENQERAFIAASRRKDRSLDARLESANRASMLHKKRTGKGFHITKDIVEKEAMYEEVDERYQEKRIKMLQAQNMQIEEEFHQHLLKAFAKRASYSNASSIASRRASNITPLPSVDNSRKMSLDLSNLRSSPFHQPHPQTQPQSQMISPMPNDYVLSPSASYDQPSYIMPESPYTMAPATPAYVQPWQNQPYSWMQMPTPDQTPTDAVQMWQQQMMHQAPENVQMRQFRDRLASAPDILHHTPPAAPAAQTNGHSQTNSHGQAHGHSRGQSQPSASFHNLHLLTQSHVPKFEASEPTHSDFCPTPHTPVSPMTAALKVELQPAVKVEADAMVSGELDPDFTDFSQFALHLGNVSEREPFGFEDFADEFATSVSC